MMTMHDAHVHTHCSPRSALSGPPGRAPGSVAAEPRRAYDGLDQHQDFAGFQIMYDAYWMAYYAPLVFSLMMRGADEGRA